MTNAYKTLTLKNGKITPTSIIMLS